MQPPRQHMAINVRRNRAHPGIPAPSIVTQTSTPLVRGGRIICCPSDPGCRLARHEGQPRGRDFDLGSEVNRDPVQPSAPKRPHRRQTQENTQEARSNLCTKAATRIQDRSARGTGEHRVDLVLCAAPRSSDQPPMFDPATTNAMVAIAKETIETMITTRWSLMLEMAAVRLAVNAVVSRTRRLILPRSSEWLRRS